MEAKTLEKASLEVAESTLGLLKCNWPSMVIPHNILDGHLLLKKKLGDEFNFIFLTPNGKIDDFRTHAIITKVGYFTNVYFYSNMQNHSILMKMLKNCTYIDWKKPCNIGPIYQEFRSDFEKLVIELNLEKVIVNEAHAYWIDLESAKKNLSKCPSEVYVEQLKEEHAELINSLWPHRFEGSISFVKTLIKNYGLGLFLKDTKEIVSWTLHCQLGGPGLLQTIDSQKGKGYGSYIASIMTKHIADNGKCSVVFIMNHNKASQSIFTKLGYRKNTPAAWITTQPPNVKN